MAFSEDTITACEGARLHLKRWTVNNPRAEIVIVHGFAEHGGRYSALAEFLVARSYNVTAYDHRGHGQSDGLPGHINRFSDYEADLDCIVRATRARNNLKVWLIGHSMGGLVALRYLARYPGSVEGAAISAPLVGFAVRVPSRKAILGKIASVIAPKFRMTSEIDPSVLSRDPTVGVAYASDPLVSHLVSARWFVEAGRAMDELFAMASKISEPVLVMHGTDDRLASIDATRRLFERVGSADKKLIVYPGYYHELFNEPEKLEIYQKVTDWLEERVRN